MWHYVFNISTNTILGRIWNTCFKITNCLSYCVFPLRMSEKARSSTNCFKELTLFGLHLWLRFRTVGCHVTLTLKGKIRRYQRYLTLPSKYAEHYSTKSLPDTKDIPRCWGVFSEAGEEISYALEDEIGQSLKKKTVKWINIGFVLKYIFYYPRLLQCLCSDQRKPSICAVYSSNSDPFYRKAK